MSGGQSALLSISETQPANLSLHRMSYCEVESIWLITPATKYINVVIPAKAGIQAGTGCRIMLTVRN
jgi:hypothetical protein